MRLSCSVVTCIEASDKVLACECDDGGTTSGSCIGFGGGGMTDSECCDGVWGTERPCEGDRPIADAPASAGAPDAIAGRSRHCEADFSVG